MLPNKDNQRARLQTAPQTNRGLLELYRRKAAGLFCTTHGLQHVAEVYDTQQLSGVVAVSLRLECGCDRTSGVNVRKKAS